MLRICSKDEFEKNIDFAYELAADLTKSGYPTYCDGIKTKQMFVERSMKAFERETEEMLLFEQEGEVQGFIHYYWIPEDNYLATNSFNIERAAEQALAEFLAFVGERFTGYDLFMGFPAENEAAVNFLVGQNFECIENDYNNTAFLEKYDSIAEPGNLIRIDKENYERFQVLHDQIEGDMYWNSERILEDLDNWVIFVREKDGKPQGAVYYMDASDGWFEIFGIDLHHHEYHAQLFKDLINAALLDAKNRGGKVMTFFCEEEGEQAALECGFVCVGKYLCYKVHLE